MSITIGIYIYKMKYIMIIDYYQLSNTVQEKDAAVLEQHLLWEHGLEQRYRGNVWNSPPVLLCIKPCNRIIIRHVMHHWRGI